MVAARATVKIKSFKLCEMSSVSQRIEFWKKHYNYVKDIVDRIDKGENIPPDSISAYEIGQRAHCVDEANIAVDRLAALGNFDLPKIQ